MSKYTTEELIKANRVHADLQAGCQECPLYEERVCTSPKLQTYSADRLEAQQKEISDLKKQIAETYTEKQYRKDSMRFCKVYAGDFCSKCPIKSHCAEGDEKQIEYIQEWAKSHPEPPKISNGDKFKEVFGDDALHICFKPRNVKCNHIGDIECDACEYGINGEYKEPSDK